MSAIQKIDKLVSFISPRWALGRVQARAMLAAYEAAKPGRTRKVGVETRGPNVSTNDSVESLRAQARYLDENYDLVTGALDTLVMRIVGPKGVLVEPMVKRLDGSLHDDFNRQIAQLFGEWYKSPEVSGEYSGAMCEQLSARTWLRDGEMFAQLVNGRKQGIPDNVVPLHIELLEPDHVPVLYDMHSRSVAQGIELNKWRRPVAYWVYKEHPGEYQYRLPTTNDLKRVSSSNILHLKMIKRIGQVRGMTLLHSVIARIEDLKDYEESERIAARIAAAAAFYIKKGSPDFYQPTADEGPDRSFKMSPGMVFDRLQTGEEVGSIQSNRPSSLLEPFRNAMVRMFASGFRISYSSASKDYNGTYSAQRQELVEQWDHYSTLQQWFTDRFKRPIYEQFVRIAVAMDLLDIPPDIDRSTLLRAHYQGPAMPWIDPDKESKANERNNLAGYKTRSSIIRSQNQNPIEVDEQLSIERERERKLGLILTSNAEHDVTGSEEGEPNPDENNDNEEKAA